MRETLTDFLKDEKDCSILAIMASISIFYKKYNERYKVYVSKFSVNKILTEIESDCVSFWVRSKTQLWPSKQRRSLFQVVS